MARGLVVSSVSSGSIAEELEVVPGDRVLAVDGHEINDIIDFQFHTSEEEFVLFIEKANGEIWELEIERSPGEVLGIEVEGVSNEGLKLCRNNCLFCFVAQMPRGMRPTLYHKDDDYRLSLTQGSFITLSNLSDEEFERIIQLHLSPLYISVHAWDPKVRVRLMQNPHAGDLPGQLKKLAEAGITMHTQIVLVPGYNDKEVLAETVLKLGELYPAVQSIAVVPVGLTRFRRSLTPLRTFTYEEAYEILHQGEIWQKGFVEKTGKHLVYFSDEFYVIAKKNFPAPSSYDGFPQLENGVGMAAKFIQELDSVWNYLPERIPERKIHLITGVSARDFFTKLKERLEARVKGLKLVVHALENEFFGHSVSVAGLLTAGDIAKQLKDLGNEEFMIPRVMLKADEDIFLDDQTVDWLAQKIRGKAIVVDNNGIDFAEKLVGRTLEVKYNG